MKPTLSLLYGSALWTVLLLTGCKSNKKVEDPYLTTDPAETVLFEAEEASNTITINTNQPVWNFSVEEGQEWCDASKGQGNKLVISANYNYGDAERTTTITITAGSQEEPELLSQTLTITQSGTVNKAARLLDRTAYFEKYPEDVSGSPAYTVSTEAIRLDFFGWGESTDKTFTLNFPDNSENYNRAILKYRMGAWNEGCSSYDNTTMFFIKNKADGQWYEITRAMTPFGNSFGSTWERYYYFDVTDYLSMMEGATEFKVYYGGFDATSTRAHTATLTFDLYAGEQARTAVYYAKVYDSSRDGNSGYRGFAYGVAGHDIEAPERMGEKAFQIPADVNELEMKVTITGHGHDQGKFPDRPNYSTKNAAEFDENTYTVKVNGEAAAYPGSIFIACGNNYSQAGTCYYDRANWCPGNPALIHWWRILDVPQGGGEITLDLDLERFISASSAPNAEGTAQYIVEVDLIGYKTAAAQ